MTFGAWWTGHGGDGPAPRKQAFSVQTGVFGAID
jgi:hypothetical protein